MTQDELYARVGQAAGADGRLPLPAMSDASAAELGRLIVHISRAVEALPNVARAHVSRCGDGLAHLHVFFSDPSPELSAVHVALLRGELGRPAEDRKTNLRAELTSFVGRDADVAAVRKLLAEHRLATLIGPGGAGKTRLAAETARTLLGAEPDGAWLVEFAPIGTDGDVAQATIAALGLRDALLGDASNAEPANRLIAAIRDREALLILDNCEHVIEQAAAFAHRVLGACRRLRILATSREPLGITGEALWQVEPLALPPGGASPGEIESAPAIQLLRDRAGAVRSDLALDPSTLPTMVRVAAALEGMPLAIELAAARLRTLSLGQLATGLDDRFRLLTGGSRTGLPHHRTLRAVVDWSWDLLTESERTVLRKLSVFAGDASLEAAERVCAGPAVEPEHVLDLLTSLTDKSLLRTAGGGTPRYQMAATIREYAARRLAEAGEADPARAAHLAYFTDLAETAEPHLRRAEQLDWLATLGAEHDNISAAMRGALAAGQAQAAVRLAASAGFYWWLGGHRAEGFELITAATKLPGDVSDEFRAMAYALVVMFVTAGRADEREAEDRIRTAARLSQRGQHRYPVLRLVVPLERLLQGPDAFLPAWEPVADDEDPWVRALAQFQLGKMRVLLGQGGLDADAYLERSVAGFRTIGERYGIALARTELADRIATRGEFAAACDHYEQAISAVTELGAIEDVIWMRARQAQLYWLLSDQELSSAAMARAERYAERVTWPDALVELALAHAELARWRGRADDVRRQLGIVTDLLGAGANRANIRALEQDLLGYLAADLGAARGHRAAACQAAAEAGYAPLIAKVLIGVADLAYRRDDPEQAARLLAASAAVRGLPDRSHPDAVRLERDVRSRLGEAQFAAATRAGTQASWDQLIEVTLAP